MKTKSNKRILAEKLRLEQGYSYSEISKQIGVSKSTLSDWLKHLRLTEDQSQKIQERIANNQAAFAASAWKTNHERFQRARVQAFQKGVNVTLSLPDHDAVHELALAMLYLGEGDKTGNRVQIANTDPLILRYFCRMLRKLYHVDEQAISYRLHLIEAVRSMEIQMIEWWADQLECSIHQFKKSQYDHRSKEIKITSDYHGVCTITYNDTYLYQRLRGIYTAYLNDMLT